MKKVSVIIPLLLSLNQLFSQQIPLYSSYYINPFLYNPSMAGAEGHVNAFLAHSIQWSDFQGAPVTSAFTLEGPVKKKNVGLGLSIFNDVTDISKRTGVYGSYSYKLSINEKAKLLMGLSLGILDNTIDFSRVVVKDYSDPFLLSQNQRKTVADGSVGATFIWKDLQIAEVIPQLMANAVKYADNNARGYYNLSRHFLTSFQYNFMLNKENNLKFSPLILVRTVAGAPVQCDVNAVVSWKETAWFDLSYKSNYAIGISGAIKIYNNFKVGYAYDIITSPINSYVGISNQLMINYIIGGVEKDSSNARLRRQQQLIVDFENKLKLNETENGKLKTQILQLKEEIGKVKDGIKDAESESQKLKTDEKETIDLLKARLQILEDKLKIILSMTGE